ncbi:SH3 domain-containing protein [Ferrimonas marina]|uniref:SH3 domain-containing protein n=1 Tax=Ferrimonas marina TaxID=299255 RepID=A0A1M5XDT5_9GAMM|nr:SH3 domain-containing protein [Ferrimonas marina]SHH97919.1 hypothetical protein SAMN02745129_3459 [Ferrimonas marina]
MQFLVINPHSSQYPNPIQFNAGEQVSLGVEDTEFPGWVRTTTGDGNQGWAPKSYFRVENGEAIALCDYSARELDTQVGEHLTLKQSLLGWGWVENAQGERGWVPLNTLKMAG